MIKKEILAFTLAFLFLFPIVSAIDTRITVIADPNHDAVLNVFKSGQTNYPLKVFSKNTFAEGNFTVIYSGEELEIDVEIIIKKDGVKISSQKYSYNLAGKDLVIDLISELNKKKEQEAKEKALQEKLEAERKAAEEVAKEAERLNASLSQNATQNTTSNSPTGFKISNIKDSIVNNVWYIIGLILVIALIVFIVRWKKSHPSTNDFSSKKEIKHRIEHRHPSSIKQSQDERIEVKEDDKELIKAERKIKEAQNEIEKIKNRGKISKMKEKLEAEKKRIKRQEEELKRISG